MSMAGLLTVLPRALSPSDFVLDAVTVMHERKLGAVAIESRRKLCGMFTYRDLIERVTLPKRPPDRTALDEVMTKEVVSLGKDTSYSEALRIMVSNDYTYLPIVDEAHRLLGMVALRDLLMHRIDDLARELDSVSRYYAVDGPGG